MEEKETTTGVVDTSLAMVGLGFTSNGADTNTNTNTDPVQLQESSSTSPMPFQSIQQQQLLSAPATPDPNVPTHYENWS